jgi:hypothetical protein
VGTGLAVATALGCHGRPDVPAERPAAAGAVGVRQLRTGYDGPVSALAHVAEGEYVVAGGAAAWAAGWARAGLAGPPPAVAFDREVGVLYGFGRGSCAAYRVGVDSARAVLPDTVRVYLWEDHREACVDTTSYSVLAAAVARPAGSAPVPHVVFRWGNRWRDRFLDRAPR